MSNAIDQTYRSAASIDAGGAVGFTFSADEPERLRGPQCTKYWADEEEAHYAGIQEERDAEASELRLSVIEYLDKQHAECGTVADKLARTMSMFVSAVARDEAVGQLEQWAANYWDALEIVRNIEGVPAWAAWQEGVPAWQR